MFVRTGVLMVLCLTTGISNLMAFPTPAPLLDQIPSAKDHSTFSGDDDQAAREFQNILASNGKRFMSDIVRSFLSPEDIRSAADLVQAPAVHPTNNIEETLESPDTSSGIVSSHNRLSRNADQRDETPNAVDIAEANSESKASSSLPYIPGYSSDGSSSSSTSSSSSNPLYGGLSPGLPNRGSGDPTLIIGGFNILVIPLRGVSGSNMGNMLQNGQQLSQLAPGNPFATNNAAV